MLFARRLVWTGLGANNIMHDSGVIIDFVSYHLFLYILELLVMLTTYCYLFLVILEVLVVSRDLSVRQ